LNFSFGNREVARQLTEDEHLESCILINYLSTKMFRKKKEEKKRDNILHNFIEPVGYGQSWSIGYHVSLRLLLKL